MGTLLASKIVPCVYSYTFSTTIQDYGRGSKSQVSLRDANLLFITYRHQWGKEVPHFLLYKPQHA